MPMTNNTEQRRVGDTEREPFERWLIMQSKMPYMSPSQIAELAWYARAALAQRENTATPLEQVWDYKPKLHAASYQHNGIDYAITLEGCNEEVHAHAMRLGMAIDGNIVHQEMLSAAPAPSLCTAEEAAELANKLYPEYEIDDDWNPISWPELANIINADRAKR
jgi:hypothetical protein